MTGRSVAVLLITVGASVMGLAAQQPEPALTIQDLFRRNVGSTAQQDAQFPPHKIVGNVFYVGTESLAAFLVTTPAGHILINSDYERNVPTIQDSVTKLGFKFTDIKILIGSHAHGDHMQGDAMVVDLTGAKAYAMAEDIPALQAMRSTSGKPRPAYEALKNGGVVTLGGTTLTAHHTPGHTPGCTTWTFATEEGGRTYNVLVIGSVGVNPGTNLVGNPTLVEQYQRSLAFLKSQKPDVGLGSHPAMFRMAEKHPKIAPAAPNPYIDPAGYLMEVTIQETAFNNELARQKTEGAPAGRGRGQ